MKVLSIASLLILVLITACQQAPVRDPASPHYVVPAGARLDLHDRIRIPPEHAHVYIQHGRVRDLVGTNLYFPNCKLWVRDISDDYQLVEPGTFRITKVKRYVNTLVLTALEGVQLAGFYHGVFASGGDGGANDYMYVTALELHSAEQPQVKKLLCQQLDDPGLGEHVTFIEMKQTLGALASVQVAD